MIHEVSAVFIAILLLSPLSNMTNAQAKKNDTPLGDTTVYLSVFEIRSLSTNQSDLPSFYIEATIDKQEYHSPTWQNQSYVSCGPWTCSHEVPESQVNITSTISLWDARPKGNQQCDLSGQPGPAPEGYRLNLTYNTHTGQWTGDDHLNDPSGYGRANGYDDHNGSEHDCELFFSINQTTPSPDGIPEWMKTNVYHLDPNKDYTGYDPNHDGIPLTWDWKWGYNPFANDSHATLDPDNDSLNNLLESRMAAFGADPFRRDVFVAVDTMQPSPDGINSSIPHGSFELVRTPYAIHNIVLRFDFGTMGCGGVQLPFENESKRIDMKRLYEEYFLKEAPAWRRDVFRWCALVFHNPAIGVAFVGERAYCNAWHSKGTNCFELSHYQLKNRYANQSSDGVNFTCACDVMHELGHTFGIDRLFPFGCDSILAYYPWTIAHVYCKNYRSVMNYEYVYQILDYSDGSHGFGDHNDWVAMDFHFFLPRK